MNPLTNGSANDGERHEETSFCTTNCRSPSKSSNPTAISTIMTDSPTVAVIQPGLTVIIPTFTMYKVHASKDKKEEQLIHLYIKIITKNQSARNYVFFKFMFEIIYRQ